MLQARESSARQQQLKLLWAGLGPALVSLALPTPSLALPPPHLWGRALQVLAFIAGSFPPAAQALAALPVPGAHLPYPGPALPPGVPGAFNGSPSGWAPGAEAGVPSTPGGGAGEGEGAPLTAVGLAAR